MGLARSHHLCVGQFWVSEVHLTSISWKNSSNLQRISRQAHLLCLMLPKPRESCSGGACGPTWQQKTVVAVGSSPIPTEVTFWPWAFWIMEAKLALFFIISCVVLIRKREIYEVWTRNSQVWNSSHTWKTSLGQGNNVLVFVTHTFGDPTTEKNLLFIRVLLTWDWSAAVTEPQSRDASQVTVTIKGRKKTTLALCNWKCILGPGRSPPFAVMFG